MLRRVPAYLAGLLPEGKALIWTILSFALVVSALLYVGMLLLVFVGLHRLRRGRNLVEYPVCVVIAARNEEARIGRCLQALLAQSYPADKTRIVVVDDRSEDETGNIVRSFARSCARIRLISVAAVPDGFSPKKHALELGVADSRSEIILTTDADSVPGPAWIEELVRLFEPDVGVAIGVVEMDLTNRPGLLRMLQALELLSYSVFTAGAVGVGWTINANAGSLAYRRRAFDQVGGLRHTPSVVSGDDVLLVQRVRAHTSWKIRFAPAEQAFVKTAPAKTLADFRHQRSRWASKCTRYPKRDVAILAGTFLFFLLLATMLPASIAGLGDWRVPAACWCAKVFLDLVVLARGCSIFRRRSLLKVFPLAEVLHVPYIVIAAIWGVFFAFEWKGTRYQPAAAPGTVARELYEKHATRQSV